MISMKKIRKILLLLIMLITIPLTQVSAGKIKIIIDDAEIKTDIAPLIINQRTMVPVRVVSESLGYRVDWENDTQSVIINDDASLKKLKIRIGDNEGALEFGSEDGSKEAPQYDIILDSPPVIINNRTFVPLRIIGEAFGKEVSWDNDRRSVVISSKKFIEALVVKVVDGDTIIVKINDEEYRLRLIGVDTPETKHPTKEVESFGEEAYQYTKDSLLGKTVYLERDVSETDKYGRLLRYVWIMMPFDNFVTEDSVEGMQFNAILVREGYAKAISYPPDIKYQEIFSELEKGAREHKLGLWANEDLTPIDTHFKKQELNQIEEPTAKYIGNTNTQKFHHSYCNSVKDIKPKHIMNLNSREEAIEKSFVPCKGCNP